jgi:tRNA A-37 threonylcarbamoyl transferase component Bud32
MRIPLLNERKLVKTKLNFEFSDMRTRWWLRDETLVPLAKSTADAVRDILEDVIPARVKILKRTIFERSERKNVFRINNPESSEQFFVVKVFFGDRKSNAAEGNHKNTARIKLRYRLRSSRYSLNEVANLFRATDKGINTPRVYGYGHLRGRLRLVKASIIILEDLGASTLENMLMQAESEEERSRIFLQTVPLFVSLFRAHCNHIDVNNNAIILADYESKSVPYLLDFQHANFCRKPSFEVLMFEASTLAKSCRSILSHETIEHWLDELLSAVEIYEACDRQKVRGYFDYYLNTSLSRKKCRKIC